MMVQARNVLVVFAKATVLPVMLLGAVSCGDSGSSGSGGSHNWYGVWEGTLSSDTTGRDYSLSLTFKDKQSGTELTSYHGPATSNHPCLEPGSDFSFYNHDDYYSLFVGAPHPRGGLIDARNPKRSGDTIQGPYRAGPFHESDPACISETGYLILNKKY